MYKIFYTPSDIAYIINKYSLDIVDASELISNIFKKDHTYISGKYRFSQKVFAIDIMDNVNYLNNRELYKDEICAIQKDFEDLGIENHMPDYKDPNYIYLFFKELRIKLLFLSEKPYTRMKLRTLLASLGYYKPSNIIMKYIREALEFYRISATLRGGTVCNINKIDIDEMITLKPF